MEDNGRDRVGSATGTERTMVDMGGRNTDGEDEGENEKGHLTALWSNHG